jgi:hypothetical protein
MGKALLQYLGFLTGQEPEPGQQLYNYEFPGGRGQRTPDQDGNATDD